MKSAKKIGKFTMKDVQFNKDKLPGLTGGVSQSVHHINYGPLNIDKEMEDFIKNGHPPRKRTS
jgi:hypothetical protein